MAALILRTQANRRDAVEAVAKQPGSRKTNKSLCLLPVRGRSRSRSFVRQESWKSNRPANCAPRASDEVLRKLRELLCAQQEHLNNLSCRDVCLVTLGMTQNSLQNRTFLPLETSYSPGLSPGLSCWNWQLSTLNPHLWRSCHSCVDPKPAPVSRERRAIDAAMSSSTLRTLFCLSEMLRRVFDETVPAFLGHVDQNLH